jgi:hypothetical protein
VQARRDSGSPLPARRRQPLRAPRRHSGGASASCPACALPRARAAALRTTRLHASATAATLVAYALARAASHLRVHVRLAVSGHLALLGDGEVDEHLRDIAQPASVQPRLQHPVLRARAREPASAPAARGALARARRCAQRWAGGVAPRANTRTVRSATAQQRCVRIAPAHPRACMKTRSSRRDGGVASTMDCSASLRVAIRIGIADGLPSGVMYSAAGTGWPRRTTWTGCAQRRSGAVRVSAAAVRRARRAVAPRASAQRERRKRRRTMSAPSPMRSSAAPTRPAPTMTAGTTRGGAAGAEEAMTTPLRRAAGRGSAQRTAAPERAATRIHVEG